MYPLSVITWRLGKKINSEVIESLILSDEKLENVFSKLLGEYKGLFYLSTCQRILIATDTSSELLTQNLYHQFLRELGTNPRSMPFQPEIYHGIDALHHLGMVVTSLDSIVIGEVQVQGQFRDAFKNQSKYLSKSLKKTLSEVIRMGKRVRARTFLVKDKISTISLVESILTNELHEESSIGIIGTGEMGLGILDFLKPKYENLDLYSRTSCRINRSINGLMVKDFDDLQKHDVLIVATGSDGPVITKSNVSHLINGKLTVVDLGMPRNCDPNIGELPNLTLIGIEDLVIHSKNNVEHSELDQAYGILGREISGIINDYQKKKKSNAIVSLRNDLLEAANSRKSEFDIKADPKYAVKFDQFINQLIHVSQKHLENILEK
jgi:glutamyl-tRNA reductase